MVKLAEKFKFLDPQSLGIGSLCQQQPTDLDVH